jgi:hypothetical protein
VYAQAEAAEALADFVPVRLEAEAHQPLVQKLGVGGLPAFLIIAPSGDILFSNMGAIPLDNFVSIVKQTRAAVGQQEP